LQGHGVDYAGACSRVSRERSGLAQLQAGRQVQALEAGYWHLQHPRPERRTTARRCLPCAGQRHRQALAWSASLAIGALEEMSIITLDIAKQYLDVIHNSDDAKLQRLLDGAEDEAAQYMNRSLSDLLPEEVSSENPDDLPGSVLLGVMLLLQAVYQATPDDAEKLRKAAEVKLAPYRCGWGA